MLEDLYHPFLEILGAVFILGFTILTRHNLKPYPTIATFQRKKCGKGTKVDQTL
jgi:hypothetical protein